MSGLFRRNLTINIELSDDTVREFMQSEGVGFDVREGKIRLKILAGKGLKLDEKQLVLDIDDDFLINNNKLGINFQNIISKLICDKNPDQINSYDFLTDLKVNLIGNKLEITKTKTTFDVKENKAGFVVDFVPTKAEIILDEITLPDGYSNNTYYAAITKAESENKPNFYKP